MATERVWLKEDTSALINMFEGFPELWQIKSKMYRDRVKKQKALKLIAEKFDTTEAEIQRNYIIFVRKQSRNGIKLEKKGYSTDEIFTSSWEYFEPVKFLLDQHIRSGSEDNLMVKTSNLNRESEREQEAVKEFECPICLSYAAPPIMMCQSSHVVCNSCWKKCYNCPTCRAPKTLTRAFTLENIYPLLTFPCKYEGCSFQGNGAFTPIHEQSCMFYPIICPLKNAYECTWKGPIGQTERHLLQCHKENVFFESSVKLMSRRLARSNKTNYAVIFCISGKIFRFTLEHDKSISPEVQFNMVQIGCRNNNDYFRYTLRFFNMYSPNKGSCVTMHAMISKDYNELLPAEHVQSQLSTAKWRLHFNQLMSYCTTETGDLYYEVTVQKCYHNTRKKPFGRCYRRY